MIYPDATQEKSTFINVIEALYTMEVSAIAGFHVTSFSKTKKHQSWSFSVQSTLSKTDTSGTGLSCPS